MIVGLIVSFDRRGLALADGLRSPWPDTAVLAQSVPDRDRVPPSCRGRLQAWNRPARDLARCRAHG